MPIIYPTMAELLAGKLNNPNETQPAIIIPNAMSRANTGRKKKKKKPTFQQSDCTRQTAEEHIKKELNNDDVDSENSENSYDSPHNMDQIPKQEPENNYYQEPDSDEVDNPNETNESNEGAFYYMDYGPVKTEENNVNKLLTLEETQGPAKRKIYLGNLCRSTTDNTLRQHMLKYGGIKSISIKKGNGTRPCKATISYKNVEDAEKAYAENGKIWNGRHINVENGVPTRLNPEKSILVFNFTPEVDREDLWRIFECCGKIDRVKLYTYGESGQPGRGSITFESPESVEKALEMKVLLYNQPVKISRPRTIARKRKTRKKCKSSSNQKDKSPISSTNNSFQVETKRGPKRPHPNNLKDCAPQIKKEKPQP